MFSGDVIYDGDLLDELHCSHIPAYVASCEHLQNLLIQTVYPGHYQTFGKDHCQQLIIEYLEARRKPGCPSDEAALKVVFPQSIRRVETLPFMLPDSIIRE